MNSFFYLEILIMMEYWFKYTNYENTEEILFAFS